MSVLDDILAKHSGEEPKERETTLDRIMKRGPQVPAAEPVPGAAYAEPIGPEPPAPDPLLEQLEQQYDAGLKQISGMVAVDPRIAQELEAAGQEATPEALLGPRPWEHGVDPESGARFTGPQGQMAAADAWRAKMGPLIAQARAKREEQIEARREEQRKRVMSGVAMWRAYPDVFAAPKSVSPEEQFKEAARIGVLPNEATMQRAFNEDLLEALAPGAELPTEEVVKEHAARYKQVLDSDQHKRLEELFGTSYEALKHHAPLVAEAREWVKKGAVWENMPDLMSMTPEQQATFIWATYHAPKADGDPLHGPRFLIEDAVMRNVSFHAKSALAAVEGEGQVLRQRELETRALAAGRPELGFFGEVARQGMRMPLAAVPVVGMTLMAAELTPDYLSELSKTNLDPRLAAPLAVFGAALEGIIEYAQVETMMGRNPLGAGTRSMVMTYLLNTGSEAIEEGLGGGVRVLIPALAKGLAGEPVDAVDAFLKAVVNGAGEAGKALPTLMFLTAPGSIVQSIGQRGEAPAPVRAPEILETIARPKTGAELAATIQRQAAEGTLDLPHMREERGAPAVEAKYAPAPPAEERIAAKHEAAVEEAERGAVAEEMRREWPEVMAAEQEARIKRRAREQVPQVKAEINREIREMVQAFPTPEQARKLGAEAFEEALATEEAAKLRAGEKREEAVARLERAQRAEYLLEAAELGEVRAELRKRYQVDQMQEVAADRNYPAKIREAARAEAETGRAAVQAAKVEKKPRLGRRPAQPAMPARKEAAPRKPRLEAAPTPAAVPKPKLKPRLAPEPAPAEPTAAEPTARQMSRYFEEHPNVRGAIDPKTGKIYVPETKGLVKPAEAKDAFELVTNTREGIAAHEVGHRVYPKLPPGIATTWKRIHGEVSERLGKSDPAEEFDHAYSLARVGQGRFEIAPEYTAFMKEHAATINRLSPGTTVTIKTPKKKPPMPKKIEPTMQVQLGNLLKAAGDLDPDAASIVRKAVTDAREAARAGNAARAIANIKIAQGQLKLPRKPKMKLEDVVTKPEPKAEQAELIDVGRPELRAERAPASIAPGYLEDLPGQMQLEPVKKKPRLGEAARWGGKVQSRRNSFKSALAAVGKRSDSKTATPEWIDAAQLDPFAGPEVAVHGAGVPAVGPGAPDAAQAFRKAAEEHNAPKEAVDKAMAVRDELMKLWQQGRKEGRATVFGKEKPKKMTLRQFDRTIEQGKATLAGLEQDLSTAKGPERSRIGKEMVALIDKIGELTHQRSLVEKGKPVGIKELAVDAPSHLKESLRANPPSADQRERIEREVTAATTGMAKRLGKKHFLAKGETRKPTLGEAVKRSWTYGIFGTRQLNPEVIMREVAGEKSLAYDMVVNRTAEASDASAREYVAMSDLVLMSMKQSNADIEYLAGVNKKIVPFALPPGGDVKVWKATIDEALGLVATARDPKNMPFVQRDGITVRANAREVKLRAEDVKAVERYLTRKHGPSWQFMLLTRQEVINKHGTQRVAATYLADTGRQMPVHESWFMRFRDGRHVAEIKANLLLPDTPQQDAMADLDLPESEQEVSQVLEALKERPEVMKGRRLTQQELRDWRRLKERTAIKAPLLIRPYTEMLAEYVHQASNYIGKAVVARDAQLLMTDKRFRQALVDGIPNGAKVHQQLVEHVQAWKAVDPKYRPDVEKWMNKILRRAARAVLAQPQIYGYQAVSMENAAQEMPRRYLYDMVGKRRVLLNDQQIKRIVPELYLRFRGESHFLISPALTPGEGDAWNMFYGGKPKWMDRITMGPLHAVDTMVIRRIASGCYQWVKDEGKTGQELMVEARRRAMRVVNRTQPTMEPMTISNLQLWGRTHPGAKVFVMFSSQSTKNLNMAYAAALDFQASNKSTEDYAVLVRDTLRPTLMNATAIYAMSHGYGALLGLLTGTKRREKEWWDHVSGILDRVYGGWLGGRDILFELKRKATDVVRDAQAELRRQRGEKVRGRPPFLRPDERRHLLGTVAVEMYRLFEKLGDALAKEVIKSKKRPRARVDAILQTIRSMSLMLGLPGLAVERPLRPLLREAARR